MMGSHVACVCRNLEIPSEAGAKFGGRLSFERMLNRATFSQKGLYNEIKKEYKTALKHSEETGTVGETFRKYLKGCEDMEDYRRKIKDLSSIQREIERLKARGKKAVFTNGCFDILHPGHTRYLWAARQFGDYLVVAVNSDRSVRAIKGEGRPITTADQRSELLAALSFVDGVVIFDEDSPLMVVRALLPDVLVKGGDWPVDKIIGADVVKGAGGEIRSIPFVPGYSSTGIIRRIREG